MTIKTVEEFQQAQQNAAKYQNEGGEPYQWPTKKDLARALKNFSGPVSVEVMGRHDVTSVKAVKFDLIDTLKAGGETPCDLALFFDGWGGVSLTSNHMMRG